MYLESGDEVLLYIFIANKPSLIQTLCIFLESEDKGLLGIFITNNIIPHTDLKTFTLNLERRDCQIPLLPTNNPLWRPIYIYMESGDLDLLDIIISNKLSVIQTYKHLPGI